MKKPMTGEIMGKKIIQIVNILPKSPAIVKPHFVQALANTTVQTTLKNRKATSQPPWKQSKAMAEHPAKTAKSQAQWVIFSDLLTRCHREQLEQGRFFALWADVDQIDV
jgi:hypothetical protein